MGDRGGGRRLLLQLPTVNVFNKEREQTALRFCHKKFKVPTHVLSAFVGRRPESAVSHPRFAPAIHYFKKPL